jgi:hypothetical protein
MSRLLPGDAAPAASGWPAILSRRERLRMLIGFARASASAVVDRAAMQLRWHTGLLDASQTRWMKKATHDNRNRLGVDRIVHTASRRSNVDLTGGWRKRT